MSVYLAACVSAFLCVWLGVCLCLWLSVYLSVCISGCLCICLSVYLDVCLCLWLSVYLAVCISVCLSVCLCLCLSVYLSVCVSGCLSCPSQCISSKIKCLFVRSVICLLASIHSVLCTFAHLSFCLDVSCYIRWPTCLFIRACPWRLAFLSLSLFACLFLPFRLSVCLCKLISLCWCWIGFCLSRPLAIGLCSRHGVESPSSRPPSGLSEISSCREICALRRTYRWGRWDRWYASETGDTSIEEERQTLVIGDVLPTAILYHLCTPSHTHARPRALTYMHTDIHNNNNY